MTKLTNPVPLFLAQNGELLDGGYIYIGVAGADPEASPIDLFWDAERTIPAAQPLRVVGGAVVNAGRRATVFFAEEDYSFRSRDVNGSTIDNEPSALPAGVAPQPLDSDLTAIAALSTTAFGRSLLTLANPTALRAAAEVQAGLGTTGGTMTGNIVRGSGGVHLYYVNPAYQSGRVFDPSYTTDPTSAVGDLWLKPDA